MARTPDPRTTTTLRLDDALYQALRNLAAKTKIPANDLVTEALTLYIDWRLDDALHRGLSKLAETTQRPAKALVKDALTLFIDELASVDAGEPKDETP